MKQFNLFPVARGIVAIIHSQYKLKYSISHIYTYIIQIGKGQAHIQKKKKNTYSGQGDLELILNRQLLNLRIIHSGCKTKFINVVKEKKIE